MRRIVVLALLLGVALLLLPLAQYRFLFVRHTESVYVGLISVLCASVGIWAGLNWRERQAARAQAGVQADDTVAATLGLTQREVEVLQLIAEGKSNQEIASALFVSLNTVKTHISNLFSKLEVQRRTQAVQKARALKLIP